MQRLLVPCDGSANAVRAVRYAADLAKKECFRTGSPANEIALHAREAGCDAIVMGTRGMGPIAGVMIGSVATHTVHLVHVPVTLVK